MAVTATQICLRGVCVCVCVYVCLCVCVCVCVCVCLCGVCVGSQAYETLMSLVAKANGGNFWSVREREDSQLRGC